MSTALPAAPTHPLLSHDLVSRVLALLGMEHWDAAAAVSHTWLAAAVSTAAEWRVLGREAVVLCEGDYPFVTELADGTLCLSDARRHRLLVTASADSSLLRTLGRHGYRPGEFEAPLGTACDDDGRIFVVDRERHQVHALSVATGAVLACCGGLGSGAGRLRGPRCCAAVAGRLYVTDAGNDRVVCLDASDVSFDSCWGQRGDAPGEFDGPCGIATDGAETLVVADLCNHRLQLFELDGTLRRVVGRRGGAAGEFEGPWGVAIGGGCLFVCEMAGRRIQVLEWPSCAVRQLLPLPDTPTICAQMGLRGIGVGGRSGRVYVADTARRRVVAFSVSSSSCRAALAAACRPSVAWEQQPSAAALLGAADSGETPTGDVDAHEAIALELPAEEGAVTVDGAACRRRRLRGAGFEVDDDPDDTDDVAAGVPTDTWRRLQIEEEGEEEEKEEEDADADADADADGESVAESAISRAGLEESD